jgi:predicted acylesterase/phospholipase RssA
VIALALGGGGSKGDFQVGAAKYIYQELGVRPNLIIGCSAGSLNGAKLAEGGDDAPARLEAIWRNFDTNADMYQGEQWIRDLEPHLQEIVAQFAVGATTFLLGFLFPPFGW